MKYYSISKSSKAHPVMICCLFGSEYSPSKFFKPGPITISASNFNMRIQNSNNPTKLRIQNIHHNGTANNETSRHLSNIRANSSSVHSDEDVQLANEVKDATYYLVKELQEQDSSYGNRRRSLDESGMSSPDRTSKSISTKIYRALRPKSTKTSQSGTSPATN